MQLIDKDKIYSDLYDADAITFKGLRMLANADEVDVIFCRDCLHDGMSECPLCWIENHTMQFINHDPDFFCGKGERREVKDDGKL